MYTYTPNPIHTPIAPTEWTSMSIYTTNTHTIT